jgi:transmembrane sensor
VEELIIRSLEGRASEGEERELRDWRRTSLDHERQYRRLRQVWLATAPDPDELEGDAEVPVPDVAELLSARSSGPAVDLPRAASRRQPRGWLPWLAIAAGIFSLVFGVQRGFNPGSPDLAYGAAEFVTGADEVVTTRLTDGTVIRLGPQSRLLVRGMRETREVWLDGRAFFAVARDEARPFLVRTRAGEALVLGTRFEMRVEGDDMRLLVVEGRVSVEASGEQVQVTDGEVTKVAAGARPAIEKVGEIRPELEWMGRFLAFERTPLRTVAREIEEVYGIRVLVPDSTLAEQTITAWFSTENPEEVLIVVCRILNAHCSLRDSVASIEP